VVFAAPASIRARREILRSVTAARSCPPAEELDDLRRLAVAADRRHAQHVGQHELRVAVFGVLVEQFLKDRARIGGEAAPEVLAFALEARGALRRAAGVKAAARRSMVTRRRCLASS
jgi:hypothetical protein